MGECAVNFLELIPYEAGGTPYIFGSTCLNAEAFLNEEE